SSKVNHESSTFVIGASVFKHAGNGSTEGDGMFNRAKGEMEPVSVPDGCGLQTKLRFESARLIGGERGELFERAAGAGIVLLQVQHSHSPLPVRRIIGQPLQIIV